MDIPDNLPDPALSRLLARLYDIADTLDPSDADVLRDALEPPFDRLSYRLTPGEPTVVKVAVITGQGVWEITRLDAATIGISVDDNGGVYTPSTLI